MYVIKNEHDGKTEYYVTSDVFTDSREKATAFYFAIVASAEADALRRKYPGHTLTVEEQ